MNEPFDIRDEFEDRLADQALRETIGGKRPPDLSQRIVKAGTRAPVRRRWRRYALAASLMAVACLGGLAYFADYLRGPSSGTGSGGGMEKMMARASGDAAAEGSAAETELTPQALMQHMQPMRSSRDHAAREMIPASKAIASAHYSITTEYDSFTVRKPVYETKSRLDANGDRMFTVSKPVLEPKPLPNGIADQAPEQGNPQAPDQGQGPGDAGDRYDRIVENPFLETADNPLSTFSIDVDTASYAKARRYLLETNTLPPPDAVRIEEFVNYFSYDYPQPNGDAPFSAHMEAAACPWQPEHRLLRIGLKGYEVPDAQRPSSNLVFLLDVSGSMEPEDRLPRVRRAMRMLVDKLGENDHVAIVVYAGASGLVLPSTSGYRREAIVSALENLQAGGSTNGGEGIRLAYDIAAAAFIKGGANRVILCTDGDFNVGATSTAELERLAEEKAKTGVFLTVLGFGMGNHNDDMLEKLAFKGNGNYGYIDSDQEAQKLLVEQMGGTLLTIAKDVKLQVEFNPAQVGAYRLIGYENRLLRAEDFNDDRKDAGEIGAGHTVTALYEIVPAGKPVESPAVDPLKYQKPAEPTTAATSGELLTLSIRYKVPDGDQSVRLQFALRDEGRPFGAASADFKFAAAVAQFAMLLRNSAYRGNATYDAVLETAREALGADPHGYRTAFLEMVAKAKAIAGR